MSASSSAAHPTTVRMIGKWLMSVWMYGQSMGVLADCEPSSRRASHQLRLGEEEPRLARRVLVRVRRVDRVPLLRFGVELSHRAGVGLRRIGCTDRRPQRRYGAGLFEHHRHAGTGCHECDERVVEWPLAVHRVELAGHGRCQVYDARSANFETLRFQVRHDLSRLAAAKRIRLDDRQRIIAGRQSTTARSSHRHGPMSLRTMSPRVRKPTSRPSRTTGTRSTSLLLINAATSATGCSGATHNTCRVMTSRTVLLAPSTAGGADRKSVV